MSSDSGGELYRKDSIGKCDAYSNPFDLRFEADLARKRLGERNIGAGPDELEADGARLERQLIEKFQKNQFSLLKSEKMGGVITGGKFILLAFVMPAYLFFYGLPRWLMQHTFPPLAALLAQAAEAVNGIARFAVQFTQNIFTAITNKAESLIGWNKGEDAKNSRGFIHWTFNAAKKGVENKINSFSEAAVSVYNGLIKAVAGVYHFFADPVINSVQKKMDSAVNAFNGVKRQVEKVTSAIKEKIQERVEHVKEKAHRIIEGTKHLLLAPVNLAVSVYHTVTQKTVESYERVIEIGRDLRNWTVTKAKDAAKEIVEGVKEHIHTVVNQAQKVALAIASPFVASVVWAQGQAINLLAMGKDWVARGTEASKKSLVWMITKGLPKLAERILPKWLNPKHLWKRGQSWKGSFAQNFKKYRAALTKKMIAKIANAQGKIERIFKAILSSLIWIFNGLKGMALKFYKKRLKLILSYLTPRAIGNGVKNTLTFFRILFRIAKRMSRELLSDLSN